MRNRIKLKQQTRERTNLTCSTQIRRGVSHSCAFRLLRRGGFSSLSFFCFFSTLLLLNVGCCDFCVFFFFSLQSTALWLIVKEDDRSSHTRGSEKIRNIFSMFIFRHFLWTPVKWWWRCHGIGAIKGAKWLIKRTLTFVSGQSDGGEEWKNFMKLSQVLCRFLVLCESGTQERDIVG